MTLAVWLLAAVALCALVLLGVALALLVRELDRQRAERRTFVDAFMARDARELAGLRRASQPRVVRDDDEDERPAVSMIGLGG